MNTPFGSRELDALPYNRHDFQWRKVESARKYVCFGCSPWNFDGWVSARQISVVGWRECVCVPHFVARESASGNGSVGGRRRGWEANTSCCFWAFRSCFCWQGRSVWGFKRLGGQQTSTDAAIASVAAAEAWGLVHSKTSQKGVLEFRALKWFHLSRQCWLEKLGKSDGLPGARADLSHWLSQDLWSLETYSMNIQPPAVVALVAWAYSSFSHKSVSRMFSSLARERERPGNFLHAMQLQNVGSFWTIPPHLPCNWEFLDELFHASTALQQADTALVSTSQSLDFCCGVRLLVGEVVSLTVVLYFPTSRPANWTPSSPDRKCCIANHQNALALDSVSTTCCFVSC